MIIKRICVFCGSAPGARPSYQEAARKIGTVLARRNFDLVYGGGRVGLMGLVADSVLTNGGRAIGVIPEHLVTREIAHAGLTELRVVASMHERKALMEELADAFIALPGGYGTFEEFCEMLTWGQLGLHRKPCGLLNVEGYYDPLIDLFELAVREGFVPPDHRQLVLDDSDPDRLIERLLNYEPVSTTKWIDRKDT
jgi:uncharacterized protein (TIGR00730 family)